jgi:hypothetical protein
MEDYENAMNLQVSILDAVLLCGSFAALFSPEDVDANFRRTVVGQRPLLAGI